MAALNKPLCSSGGKPDLKSAPSRWREPGDILILEFLMGLPFEIWGFPPKMSYRLVAK